jgi:hypothetical protein
VPAIPSAAPRRSVGLGLIVDESFLESLYPLLFVRGGTIEGTEHVLDALHGADRIAGVSRLRKKDFRFFTACSLTLISPKEEKIRKEPVFMQGAGSTAASTCSIWVFQHPAKCAL